MPIIQMGGVPPILSGMQSKKIFGGPISLPTLAVAKQEAFASWSISPMSFQTISPPVW